MVRRTVRALGSAVGVSGLVAAGLTGVAAGPAVANGVATDVVASGLNSPRQVSFGPDGALYVAEAGKGGNGPCVDSPEGNVCFGFSGSVTKVMNGRQSRVLRGLPSLAGEGGVSGAGPSDIVVGSGGTYALTMNLGNNPAVRDDLPAAGHKFGTVLMGRFGGGPVTIADLASFEAAKDFDGQGPDNNPTSLLKDGSSYVVADAGANTLMRVRARGKMAKMALFENRLVPAPPFLPPGDIPMQPVPTAVAKGPDGAFYVSELTGFPFPAGQARIYRVKPGQAPTVWASGLTNVTDIAWVGNSLLAVQIAGSGGLLSVPPGELPTGNVVVVDRWGPPLELVGGLTAPYGLAVKGSTAYVSTCTVCAGGGQVVSFSLN